MTEVQNENLSFDNMVKELLGETPKEDVIRFINAIYDENFPLDSSVTRLATESHNDNQFRNSDVMIKIEECVFHIEVESDDKNSEMALRIFSYGYRHALLQDKTVTRDSIVLNFPTSVVIYLRSTDKTPTELTITLNLTNKESFSYKILTKRIGDYTPESLKDGSLYALGQFYPMKYERLLEKKHDAEVEEKLASELTSIFDWIDEKVKNGEISKSYAALFMDGLMKTTTKATSKAQIINEEAFGNIMENIQRRKYVLDPLNWREEGRQEERLETARKMKQKNLPFETIRECTELPMDTIQAL